MLKKTGWALLNLIALLALLFGAYTLFTLTSRGASLLLLLLGALLLLCADLPRVANLRHNRTLNTLHKALCALAAFGALFAVAISCFMLFGCRSYQGSGFDGTVIVLGCHVRGEEPSVMLRARLERAASFLKDNPRASCIVSGGQGENEDYTEAEVMKRYLLEQGIQESRVFEEGRSKNTRENLANSQKIIQENGLAQQIVIVTDRFHAYRAQLYGDKIGLDSRSVPCGTRPDLLILFWLREIPAVLQAWLVA